MNQRLRFRHFTALSTLATSVAACGGEADANAGKRMPEDEVIRLMEERGTFAEIAPDRTQKAPFFWETWINGGNSAWTGANTSGHVCVLSGLGGDLGGNYGFGLVRTAPNGDWNVSAWDDQWASALCARWSSFLGPPNSVGWVSNEYNAFIQDCDPGGRTSFTREMWWGDAASYLTKIHGEFEGGGEYAHIDQSGDPFGSSLFTSHTEAHPICPWVTMISPGARSVFVGVPGSGRRVKLWGIWNNAWVRGDVSSPGTFEFHASTQSGFSTHWLAPTDSALCYLTHVGGDFDGGAEEIHIIRNGNQWFLRPLAASGKAIIGSARCMAWDQRF